MSIGVNNSSLGGVSQFIVDDSTGKITGYKTTIGGADTVFPFKSSDRQFVLGSVNDVEQKFVPYDSGYASIQISTSYTSGSYKYIDVPYDITNFQKIILYAQIGSSHTDTTNTTYLGVTRNKPSSYSDIKNGVASTYKSTNITIDPCVIELDISTLTGEYYIGVGVSSSYNGAYTSTAYVYGIELA